jgi:type I restriction enzyme S subunit
MTLDSFLEARYPGRSEHRILVRADVKEICDRFCKAGLADPDFESNLCSGDEGRYWQRYSEALLGVELLDHGCDVRPSRDGPDMLVMSGLRKVWIEVICPEPIGIPGSWLNPPKGVAYSFPHEAILLRWTAAIKEKAEKLLGGAQRPGYLEKGIVAPDDAYVIAVNGRRLRNCIAQLDGISQLPFAAEAVFAIGPIQIHIDRETLKATGRDHQHRPLVRKPSTGADVPANTFLDPIYAPVSAIWAVDRDDCRVIGNLRPMQIVHNPNATNALPQGLLPADCEWSAMPYDANALSLERWTLSAQ